MFEMVGSGWREWFLGLPTKTLWAEWSKPLAQGASPQGRGFEPRRCQLVVMKRGRMGWKVERVDSRQWIIENSWEM